ncbi:sensor histidine kinase [Clostridium sp. CCUG 7971]|uniref:sensor histidine kinase n=1 Tax=Clostridium sp. CCUG 7971 TaxID=2811414 RepID=UPI001ABAF3EE|nr:sensor histidine kinase [Clostridium sp. CCUG 7971]MBO3445588.1 sensor histidine kinase [Clostridium sp. CCUG 7971]
MMALPSDTLNNPNNESKIYNTLRMHTMDFKEYDSIVVSGDRSLEFALKFKEDMFKDIPIVFFGISDDNLEKKALSHNLVSGIRSTDLLKPNIDLAIKNHKNIKNIHILSNSKKDFDYDIISSNKNMYKDKGININIVETSTMSLKDFTDIISKFNNNDAIIKVTPGNFTDTFLSISDLALLIDYLCKDTPVYSLSYLGLGHGEVGGKIMSHYAILKATVDIVNHIIENNPNESISIDQLEISKFVFDKNALKKFNINKSQLPKDSYILNSFKDIILRNEELFNKIVLAGIIVLFIISLMICYIIYKQKYENALKHVLRKSEDLNMFKSHLISNISHELRTPLNVITSSVQLLRYKNKNSKELTENTFDIIDNNCNRLLRLTNNLIDIDKYEYGKLNLNLENINIVDIIENIVVSTSPLANSKSLNLVFDTNDEFIYMAIDIDKIERIVLNLISNAIKFSKPNMDINVSLIKNEDNLRIIVADKGIGISQDNIKNIFKRFSQVDTSLNRKNEGSGIGLSIVDTFVKSHKGSIHVVSKLNVGTEFIIDLPIYTLNENTKSYYEYDTLNSKNNANLELSDIYL